MTTNRALQSYRVLQKGKEVVVKVYNHPNQNQYVLVDPNIWVRNFTKKVAKPVDINNLYNESEYENLTNNELASSIYNYPYLEEGFFQNKNVVILCDGYGYKESKQYVEKLNSQNYFIICLNTTLSLWENKNRTPDLFLNNNSTKDCLRHANNKISVPCVCSTRVNMDFYKEHRGPIRRYGITESLNLHFDRLPGQTIRLDEYRNPVCAAVHLCWVNNIKNIILVGCTNGTIEEKMGTIKYGNLYKLPSQKISDEIIDAMLMWYISANKEATICSIGETNSFNFSTDLSIEDLQSLV
jgi:hypothetical protein